MFDHQRRKPLLLKERHPMYRTPIVARCFILMLASMASPLMAQNVTFIFHGQVTQVQPYAQAEALFQTGDSFTLVLEYTPSGPSPAYGYYLGAGTQAVSPDSITSGSISPYGGLGPPYCDTGFKNPVEYRMYYKSYMTLTDGILSFGMMDEDAGPWGSVTVGPDFPTDWFPNMGNPLPNNADTVPFTASGTLNFNFMNFGGANLSGAITSAAVTTPAFQTDSVPEPASIAVLLFGVGGLLVRRRFVHGN